MYNMFNLREVLISDFMYALFGYEKLLVLAVNLGLVLFIYIHIWFSK